VAVSPAVSFTSKFGYQLTLPEIGDFSSVLD